MALYLQRQSSFTHLDAYIHKHIYQKIFYKEFQTDFEELWDSRYPGTGMSVELRWTLRRVTRVLEISSYLITEYFAEQLAI